MIYSATENTLVTAISIARGKLAKGEYLDIEDILRKALEDVGFINQPPLTEAELKEVREWLEIRKGLAKVGPHQIPHDWQKSGQGCFQAQVNEQDYQRQDYAQQGPVNYQEARNSANTFNGEEK